MPADSAEDLEQTVAWDDVVRFVRQLSHDLRNHLNAAELQAVYIAELADNDELKAEIKRLREIVSSLAKTLQKISGDLQEVRPTMMNYGAGEFLDDLRKKIAHEFPKESENIKWDVRLTNEAFDVDPQLLQQVFLELFANAFLHDRTPGEISAAAQAENAQFVFTLGEPKTRFDLPTENWGAEPIRHVGRGHYGLGLRRARSIIKAHNGELRARYDSGTSMLVTTLTLPLVKASP